MTTSYETSDLIVFSHLRWDFVFQRPQHLLSRFAKYRRVFYFEEPVIGITETPHLDSHHSEEGVLIVVPHLPSGLKSRDMEQSLKELLDQFLLKEHIEVFTLWYYTPMALAFTDHLKPQATLFDCIDEVSMFQEAPRNLLAMETELLKRADLVITGGHALYEAKRTSHHNVHPLPSSIDHEHFSKGRLDLVEPEDQINVPHPRVGFYGCIDERIDLDLVDKLAELRPEYQFIIIGPVVKLDSTMLPIRPNIHYLGKKDYHVLPLYLSGWDCAIMPFALNDTTRFIAPTKTPELLAAGKPIVSTPIEDVVHPYGNGRMVHIARSPVEFAECIEKAMNERAYDPEWLERVDAYLDENSWDSTFSQIAHLEKELIQRRKPTVMTDYSAPIECSHSL